MKSKKPGLESSRRPVVTAGLQGRLLPVRMVAFIGSLSWRNNCLSTAQGGQSRGLYLGYVACFELPRLFVPVALDRETQAAACVIDDFSQERSFLFRVSGHIVTVGHGQFDLQGLVFAGDTRMLD